MKKYMELVEALVPEVSEVMPWDLVDLLETSPNVMLVDIREPYEFDAVHIAGSLNVPRGILESACEYDFEDTVPELVEARDREIVVVCRSGHRSVLASYTMQLMGYQNVKSLKTGLRGWNDYEQSLVDGKGSDVAIEHADEYFFPNLRPEQLNPKRRKN